jgi:hypothetical protein
MISLRHSELFRINNKSAGHPEGSGLRRIDGLVASAEGSGENDTKKIQKNHLPARGAVRWFRQVLYSGRCVI